MSPEVKRQSQGISKQYLNWRGEERRIAFGRTKPKPQTTKQNFPSNKEKVNTAIETQSETNMTYSHWSKTRETMCVSSNLFPNGEKKTKGGARGEGGFDVAKNEVEHVLL